MSFEKYSNAKASEGPKRTTKQNMQKTHHSAKKLKFKTKAKCSVLFTYPSLNIIDHFAV